MKRKILIVILMSLVVALLAVSLVACNGGKNKPYYGTWTFGDGSYIVIDKSGLKIGDSNTENEKRYDYKISKNKIVLKGKERRSMHFFENYDVLVLDSSQRLENEIGERNGYFFKKIIYRNDEGDNLCYVFSSDGTFTINNSANVSNNGSGEYSLNHGVLQMNWTDSQGEQEEYWYIDCNSNIYIGVCIRDSWGLHFVEGKYYNGYKYINGYAVEPCATIYRNRIKKISIPSTYKGLPVVKIQRYGFCRCESLTTVIIPEGVTSIEDGAFEDCGALTSVVIPNSVTSIGVGAFAGCRSLMSIVIPDSVTSIGESAFFGCSILTSVVIPNSVTSIGVGAFYCCYGLTSITIPNSVTSISDMTFCGCRDLTSITIPNSVTAIGGRAFEECSNLTDIVIPNSVTSIGVGAFSNCISLSSIMFEDASGWYATTDRTKWQNKEGGELQDFSDPSNNAGIFADLAYYYWYTI